MNRDGAEWMREFLAAPEDARRALVREFVARMHAALDAFAQAALVVCMTDGEVLESSLVTLFEEVTPEDRDALLTGLQVALAHVPPCHMQRFEPLVTAVGRAVARTSPVVEIDAARSN